MRLISCSLTEKQVRAGTKDVTRRLGWQHLKPGDRLMFCQKVMGRRKGEPLVKIRAIEVVDVRRERLDVLIEVSRGKNLWTDYAISECRREGFPQMTPAQFVRFFCESHPGCTQATTITRIEFKYLHPFVACVHDLPLAQVRE